MSRMVSHVYFNKHQPKILLICHLIITGLLKDIPSAEADRLLSAPPITDNDLFMVGVEYIISFINNVIIVYSSFQFQFS